MLGEKIAATIKAKYYFGSPVTKAKVKYKINRTSYTERWYPVGPWDWFYGPGYWWYAYDYDWYPGWRHWGCLRPAPFWWPHAYQPPELVADQEVAIGPDGTVKVEIDTGVAKAIYPNQDQSYSITAEVVDQSRRTIVGTGTVLVARKPFSVYAWVDRGYYRVGDTVAAHFSARTLDGKPVQGKGELTLLKIGYKDGKPVETPEQTWQFDTNSDGIAQQPLAASQAGQYRLSYKLTDNCGAGASPAHAAGAAAPQKHTIEGGYIFTIIGEGFDGAQFRFNHLELIPDKREYAPGEMVKLQINTDRTGGTVLLFVRPSNGIYLPPKVIRLRRQEHGGRNRRGEKGHAQLLRRGGHHRRRAGVYRDEGDRRPAGKAGAQRRNPALEGGLQAGRKGPGEDQADRFQRRAVCRLHGGGDLRQVGGVHLRRQQRARNQGVLLEMAAPT